MRGQRVIFRSGPESLDCRPAPTSSGEGVSTLSGGIDCAFLAVVIVAVIMVVVVSDMRMHVIDDWRRQEDFTTLLRARP
jgi:hypothetical protein